MNTIRRLYHTICLIIKTTITVGCIALALTGAVMVSGGWKPKPEIVERIKEVTVERPEPSIKTLIQDIPPKYGLPPLLVAAMVERESGSQKDASRFEPGQMSRAYKQTNNEQKARMLATSWGYMQVMGWWAKDFNLSWSDLLDGETNVEVGCSILKKCLDRQKTGTKLKRIHAALWCFNGSPAYADAILSRLGGILIEQELGNL